MELILLCFNVVLLGLVLFFLISKKGGDKRQETLTALIKFDQQQAQTDKQMKDEFQRLTIMSIFFTIYFLPCSTFEAV